MLEITKLLTKKYIYNVKQHINQLMLTHDFRLVGGRIKLLVPVTSKFARFLLHSHKPYIFKKINSSHPYIWAIYLGIQQAQMTLYQY